MSSLADSELQDRALAARRFLRARSGPRRRPSLYQVYVTLLLGAIGGALAGHAIVAAIGGSLSVHDLLVCGPVALILALLGAMRFGTWQGPVGFSTPDVLILLTAPIALADLVRPKLDLGLAVGALAGAVLAGAVLLLMAAGPASVSAAGSVCAIVALSSLGVLAVAASWLVQSSRRAAGLVWRASPAVVAICAGLLWAASDSSAARSVGIWSGPWGWAVAPLAGTGGWPVCVTLIVAGATAATVLARRRAGAATVEQFLARAETRAGITASAFTLDYRSATLTYRAALPTGSRPLWRIRRPTDPRLAVPWRDSLSLIRDRSRIAWAALIAAAGTLEVLAHPGATAPAAVGAGVLYLAATLVCEPLRLDVDAPDRSALLLSKPFARLLVDHCAVPFLALMSITALTLVGAVVAGVAGPGALVLIPTVVAAVVATAVLSAALATLRGGRINETLISRMLSSDPSNPLGASVIVLWLAPWLIVNLAASGAAVLITGHAAVHHRSIVSHAGLALALSCAVAGALLARARRAQRPS